MAGDKKVVTVFELVDKMSKRLDHVGERVEKLHEKTERAKEAMENFLAPKLALIGLAAGFGELAHKIWEVGVGADDARKAIAGAYLMSDRFGKSDPGEELEKSLGKAEEIYNRLEETAIKGVASTKAYQDAFKALAPVMSKTRVESGDLSDLSSELLLRFRAMGMSSEQAIGSIGALSNAVVTGMGRPNRELLKVTHMSAKEWQKFARQSPEKLFAHIQARVGATKKDLGKMFKGPDETLQRLSNLAEKFLRKMGEPIFEKLEAAAERLEHWMSENGDEAMRFAREVGTNLADSLKTVLTIVKAIAPWWKEIVGGYIALTKSGKVFGLVKGGIAMEKKLLEFAGTLAVSSTAFAKVVPALGKFATALGVVGAALLGWNVGSALGEWLANNVEFDVDKQRNEQERTVDRRTKEMRDLRKDRLKKQFEAAQRGYELTYGRIEAPIDPTTAGYSQAFIEQMRKQEGVERKLSPAEKAEVLKKLTEKRGEWDPTWKPDKTENTFDFRNSRFDIKQEFAEGFDPDRIAVAFANDLAALGEKRLASAYSPAFGVR